MNNHITFDFNNMFSASVGKKHGVSESELKRMSGLIKKSHEHLRSILQSRESRIKIGLEWVKLPFQNKSYLGQIRALGNKIAAKYENVISLGIGGSYLGLKAAQDALMPPYYNEFAGLRKGRPKIYFEGNNLDPDTIRVLLESLNPKKTLVIVISKSGETTETKAAFAIVESWLKRSVGKLYGRQIIAITDPCCGALRKKANLEQAKDVSSFRNLPVLEGVGGRYSEFNVGLLHLAIIGIDLEELLSGAAHMAKRCSSVDLFKNPAYMYALLMYALYKRGKPIAVIMPFSEGLKATADWYVQLLAESLGKKYPRIITKTKNGLESWQPDKRRVVNTGRTPVPCRGTGDLHSVQQNLAEGKNDKTVTFIKVKNFKQDANIPGAGDFLSGKSYSRLLSLAQEATEWALVREKRPNCAIILPRVDAFHWGELLFFFEMATAFEGELLNVNAFDQPGVETYKQYMYYKLGKPGIAKETAERIANNPLLKRPKFIF